MSFSGALLSPASSLGRVVMTFVQECGAISLFFMTFIRHTLGFSSMHGQFAKQAEFVGWQSLPIVLLTAFFTGGVLALQSYAGFDNAVLAGGQVPKVVALSMLRELGPVLGALMVASRVGSAMAAELGTMRVTEQIDALYTLAVNPFKYLVMPRILACMTMLPLLVILANLVGIVGGYLVSVHILGLSGHMYTQNAYAAIGNEDVILGLVKAVIFGAIIGLMATFHGYKAGNGAAGVGMATTRAVVYAAVAILISDYFITAWFV
ncbi:MAG: ABC transporter permease [Alphaproteobacteria bacterium CG_4_10_14_0_8_um_filter_53_9]|nr:MAG: ABC transporter permease [Alphaproteobacteria bacterium CG_4_10_14_0_8_um_filter_53_9]